MPDQALATLAPRPRRIAVGTWVEHIAAVMADPSLHTVVMQPIVSVKDCRIVGYEALSRFATVDGSASPNPQDWFATAARLGVGAEFEMRTLQLVLGLMSSLPANTFVTVNLNPNLLHHPQVTQALTSRPDLKRLVIELTEDAPIADLPALQEVLAGLRSRGALLALDDVGTGYSGLQLIAELRPQLIKLDRTLVAGADTDELRLALAETVGDFANRIDAWLLAEGVETWAEVSAFAALGVPLLQGFAFAKPGPGWPTLTFEARRRLRELSRRRAPAPDGVDDLGGAADPGRQRPVRPLPVLPPDRPARSPDRLVAA